MAGRLKRKTRITINLYETLNNNRLKTGGTISAYIYPGGMQIENSVTIPASPALATVVCSGRGALGLSGSVGVVRVEDSDEGKWVRQDTGGQLLNYLSLRENTSVPGSFNASMNDSLGIGLSVQPGDRLVSLALATLYEDEGETSDTISQPIDVPTHGSIEFYCEFDSVDVYLTGDDIEDGWYAFNIPCGDSALGALTLQAETVAADIAGDLNVDTRTGIVLVNSAANNIARILHGNENRLLLLMPTVSGVTIQTSTSTTADGSIYDASGGTIVLDAFVPVLLVAKTGSPSVNHFWTILGTPNVNDFALDELTDVDAAAPQTAWPLVWDGAAWVSSGGLGTTGTPLTQVFVEHDQFGLVAGGNAAKFDASALSTDRTFTFPNLSGTFVLTSGNQTITGRKEFQDGASGFRLSNVANPSRIAQFDLSALAGSTYTYAFPASSGTFALVADIPASLDDLDDVAVTAPTAGELLAFNSGTGDFENVSDVTLDTIQILSAGFVKLNNSSGYGPKIQYAGGLGADASVYFPSKDGTVVVDSENIKCISLCIPFDDGVGATGLFNMLENIRNIMLVLKLPTDRLAAGAHLEPFVRVTYEWLLDGNSVAASPIDLGLYLIGSPVLITSTTVPPTPTSGSADEICSFSVPAAGNAYLNGEISVFTNNVSPTKDYLGLGIKTAGDGPGVSGFLNLMIQYAVTISPTA